MELVEMLLNFSDSKQENSREPLAKKETKTIQVEKI